MTNAAKRLWPTVALVAISLATWPLIAVAQSPEELAADAPALRTGEQVPQTVWELIVAGGPVNIGFFIVLGLFSLVAVTVTLERLVNLRRGRIVPRKFVRELQALLGDRRPGAAKPEGFRQLCAKSQSPIAAVLSAGLVRAGRPLPEVEKSMEDAVAREMAAMRARVRPLSVISNVAPLIGLLGTVVGMLNAFRTASQAGLGKAELLAEGIYLALETTVAGLIIAIPCILLAAWFNGRIEKYMREMDVHLMDTLPHFARMEQADARVAVRSEPSGPPVAARRTAGS